MAHHLLLNEDKKRLRKVTGSANDKIGFTAHTPNLAPTTLLSTLSTWQTFVFIKHWQFISLYNSEHQHFPTMQTDTVWLSSLVELDRQRLIPCRIIASTAAQWQKKVPHRAATAAVVVVTLAVDSGPQPQLPACQEFCRPCYHDNQVRIDLISALHLCTGSDRERTAVSFP